MIKIFSTYTKDRIYNQVNGFKIIRNGGPAFFIENVFKKNGVKYKISFQKAIIEIKTGNGTEVGVLKSKFKERKIKNIKINNIVVISTVDSEWVLDAKISDKIKIFLDAQGYVRNARENPKIYNLYFWKQVFCLKCNKEEFGELPKEIIKNQKNKCLIVTRGDRGAVIYYKRKKYIFVIKKIKAGDMIGAGDTFFAGFIIAFIKNKGNVVKSGNFAAKEVKNFLLEKKIIDL